MGDIRFTKERLPIGGDTIPVLVARRNGEPETVFLSYESFLELAATLYTAIETLKAIGVDPELVGGEEEDHLLPSIQGAGVPGMELRQVGRA